MKIKQESLSVTKIGNNITGTQITVITHQKVEVTLRVYVKTVQNQKVVVVNVDKYKPTPDFNFNEGNSKGKVKWIGSDTIIDNGDGTLSFPDSDNYIYE